MDSEDIEMTSQCVEINDILDTTLPQVAFAAERGLLTDSQIHKVQIYLIAVVRTDHRKTSL